ncbi:fungal-specific transcription factor domain-containing protein [Coniochaeta sp. 2T2.1]|nr:fungal-specific transcription factor domain-containing protein [Coniochaeta sp. 2T2.1]
MSSSSATPPDTIMVSDQNGEAANEAGSGGNSSVPKPKRLACMICRKRKLKCDGLKPSCSTCTRLGHNCAYDEVRRKSGPKRGYVKALEERLKQVETLLKTQDVAPATSAEKAKNISISVDTTSKQAQPVTAPPNFTMPEAPIGIASSRDMDRWNFNGESPQNAPIDDFNFNSNLSLGVNPMDGNFTWEMIGLGLEEPLPPQETIDELHQIYFEKIHPSVPMIHKYRYLAAMNLAPNQRPPVCLRYAMWTQACSVTDKYADLKDLFYQRARKYVELDYVKGYGEHMISISHAQTHVLLAAYEFKMMYFPRAWMSTGSAIRLCQMTGTHRLDGTALDVKQCLPPPRDWTEREERRRTFWMAFCQDRYASIGTGWPMTVDEKDIMSNLPCSEEAFEMSRPETTLTLPESMTPAGAGKLSSFGGIVLMACLFGRNLNHLHRPDADDGDDDSMNGEFWRRHRTLDNILLNTSLCLPPQLKLPAGLQSANVIFTNMCIHTSTICLHQAAIFKADKMRMPGTVSGESKIRCITAANEIASIMRMISHLDLASMNPFISFCLYVAARVFVQYLKSKADDSAVQDALRFLLSAMNALKRRNPLTESFLVQLDVDLEVLGARIPKLRNAFPRSTESVSPNDHCFWSKENVDANNHSLHQPAPPKNSWERPGAECQPTVEQDGSGPNGTAGIMAYRNECQFLRGMEDDGNPVNGPDITDATADNSGKNAGNNNNNNISQTPSSTGLTSQQSWPNDQTSSSLTTRERGGTGSGRSPYPTMHGLMPMSGAYEMDTSSNGLSGTSPGDGPSNRPTPNSSSMSSDQQHHHQRASQSTLAPGNNPLHQPSSSGRASFEASPVSGQQPPQSRSEIEQSFFDGLGGTGSGGGGYGMGPDVVGTGLTPRFTMGDATGGGTGAGEYGGWDQMPGGTGMTPVAEGMLRSIMSMGPMDTMDLGWDTETSLR